MSQDELMVAADEQESARLFAAFVDDLFADREPHTADSTLGSEESQAWRELQMTAREFKGLLSPSQAGDCFRLDLRDRLTRLARAMRDTPALALDELLVTWAPDIQTRQAVASATGLSSDQLKALQNNTLAPVAVPCASLDACCLMPCGRRRSSGSNRSCMYARWNWRRGRSRI
jgi:hypothetical protein